MERRKNLLINTAFSMELTIDKLLQQGVAVHRRKASGSETSLSGYLANPANASRCQLQLRSYGGLWK